MNYQPLFAFPDLRSSNDDVILCDDAAAKPLRQLDVHPVSITEILISLRPHLSATYLGEYGYGYYGFSIPLSVAIANNIPVIEV